MGFKSNFQKGFTLIEVIVVMVIISIMVAIIGPTLLSWMPNLRFRDASGQLLADIQLAKVEALKRNSNVVLIIETPLCPGLPNAVPDPGGQYTIFVDANTNNDLDAGEETIKIVDMPANVSLCPPADAGANPEFPNGPSGFPTTGFLSNGLPIGGISGNVTLNNDQGREVIVTLTAAGHVSM